MATDGIGDGIGIEHVALDGAKVRAAGIEVGHRAPKDSDLVALFDH